VPDGQGNYGSCGLEKAKDDPFHYVALSKAFMELPAGQSNPNKHRLCKKPHCVFLTGELATLVLKVADTCYGCKPHDLIVTQKVFELLADIEDGSTTVEWKFVDCRDEPTGQRSATEICEYNKCDDDEK